jgi:molybdate-binding protein/DNA-binding XRE family transcriptional regulator
VRVRREAAGLTQAELAEACGLSRQSVGAIEVGRSVPAVDVALRVAAALGASVEELFGEPTEERAISAEPSPRGARGRVVLAWIGDRWIARSVEDEPHLSADGLAQAAPGGRVAVEPTRPVAEARESLLVLGCAMGLGLLADRVSGRAGAGRCVWLPISSTAALDALARGHAHVGGVHLVDARSGQSNVVDVRRHAREPWTLVTLGRWEAGIVLPAGNPKRLARAADLARAGLVLATREPGSGARRLLDRALREGGARAQARSIAARGHLEVARLVASGAADAGIATRDVALALRLAFVPLAEERYDLVAPTSSIDDPRVARLFDALASLGARRELEALGYDTRDSGSRIELAA